MQPLATYLLAIFFLVYLAIFTRLGRLPLFWIFFPWIFAFLPIWTGIITYHNPPVDISTSMFIAANLFAITAGYAIVIYMKNFPPPLFSNTKKVSLHHSTICSFQISDSRSLEIRAYGKLIDTLVILGALGSIFFIFDALFVTGFARGNAFEVRQMFVESNVNPLRQLAPILAMGCFVSLLALFWFGSEVLKKRSKWYAIVAISIIAFSILSAGRQAIFQFMLFSFSAWLVTKPRRVQLKIKRKKLVAVALFLVISVELSARMLALSSERSTTLLEDQIGILLSIFGAEFHPSVAFFVESLNPELSVGFTTAILYFSSQLSSLAAIHDPGAVSTWATGMGAYEFPWLYRRLGFLGLPGLEEILSFRRTYLFDSGFMSVSWSTALAVFLHDFGYFGTFVYSFFVGILGGYFYENHKRKQSFFSFCLLIASYSYLFYMIIFPLSSDTIFFFFVVVVWFLDRRYVKKKNGIRHLRGFSFRSRRPRIDPTVKHF